VHACIPSYTGAREWENCGSRPAQAKKFLRPHLSGKNLGTVTRHTSFGRKHEIEGLQSRADWAKKARPYLQNNQSRKEREGWREGERDHF
jgi:hypothetical protein